MKYMQRARVPTSMRNPMTSTITQRWNCNRVSHVIEVSSIVLQRTIIVVPSRVSHGLAMAGRMATTRIEAAVQTPHAAVNV